MGNGEWGMEEMPRITPDVDDRGPPPPNSPFPVPHSPLVKRRSWRAKFAAAFRGVKLGVRGHSSFFVHFFFAALVLAAAVVLQCGLVQWCLLLGCIGLVLTAELF